MRLTIAVLLFLVSLLPSYSTADLFSDAWGAFTDPFKLQAGTENALNAVREARNAILGLQTLQEDLDEDVRFYLKDVDRKIDKVGELTAATVAQIAQETREIEKRVFEDILVVLRRTECAAIRTTKDIFDDAPIPSWLKNDDRIFQLPFGEKERSFLGLRFGKTSKVVTIESVSSLTPFELYLRVEDIYLTNISKDVAETTEAIRVVAIYAELARIAKKTACLFEDSQFEEILVRRYAKYNAMVYPWNYAITVEG